jgi:hypothetical protein
MSTSKLIWFENKITVPGLIPGCFDPKLQKRPWNPKLSDQIIESTAMKG